MHIWRLPFPRHLRHLSSILCTSKAEAFTSAGTPVAAKARPWKSQAQSSVAGDRTVISHPGEQRTTALKELGKHIATPCCVLMRLVRPTPKPSAKRRICCPTDKAKSARANPVAPAPQQNGGCCFCPAAKSPLPPG